MSPTKRSSNYDIFLHRLGRDANQGEVGVVVEGTYQGITEFDPD